jgi:pantoate--beta-alanine ligase
VERIDTVTGMRAFAARQARAGARVGFVPTMGALHEGHLSLVRVARACCDRVVVSVYVNPRQFGPAEDLARYPRDPDGDAALCHAAGVDALFEPPDAEMYPPGFGTEVVETSISRGLCGLVRPGHFTGVATVVVKLLNLVTPQVAVFGLKDAQQCRVVHRVVTDLNLPVELVFAPTVREADGLAMSSRNRYLSAAGRAAALCLRRGLLAARAAYGAGERQAAALQAAVCREIVREPSVDLEYVDVVRWDDFAPVVQAGEDTLIAGAIRVGTTRLIDNIIPSDAAWPGFWRR